MNSDLLDEYCDEVFGHTDWEINQDDEGNLVVKFYKEPTKQYLQDMGEETIESVPVRMRDDLAEEGITIPGGKSYKDYDDLQEIEHFSAEDLEGAVAYDTGEDPDDHAFCPVKLKDGRVFYFIGVDLEWFND